MANFHLLQDGMKGHHDSHGFSRSEHLGSTPRVNDALRQHRNDAHGAKSRPIHRIRARGTRRVRAAAASAEKPRAAAGGHGPGECHGAVCGGAAAPRGGAADGGSKPTDLESECGTVSREGGQGTVSEWSEAMEE